MSSAGTIAGLNSQTNKSSSSSSASSASKLSTQMKLTSDDFINLMVTELKNQDPTKPASNEELLSQMSQIGQLQSSTDLTSSLKGMVLQNALGSASNMIGKSVNGIDDAKDNVSGLVNSVRVEDSDVYLELDTGKTLKLSNVTNVSNGPTGTTSSTDASKSTTGSTTGTTTGSTSTGTGVTK